MSRISFFETAADPGTYTGGNAGTTVVYAIPLAIGAIVLIRACRKAGRTLDYRESPKEW